MLDPKATASPEYVNDFASKRGLPPGTTAFASDISPFYDVPENYHITVSIRGVATIYTVARQGTFTDFFGAVSSEPIDYVEFAHETSYMTLWRSYFLQ